MGKGILELEITPMVGPMDEPSTNTFQINFMKRHLLFLMLICSCSGSPPHHNSKKGNSSRTIKSSIFKSEYGGFGYDIKIDGKLLVHQPNVPVINNYRGFATVQEARNIAALVVLKIKNNEVPPTLTATEIDSLLK